MYYWIDGYNLIFSLPTYSEAIKDFAGLRQRLIRTLRKQFAKKKISATLVFDGAHRRDEESGLSYPTPLTVAYAPKGQSADEYIVERIALASNPKEMTVVTNDRGLARHAKAAGAKVQPNQDFIAWLKKGTKKDRPEPKESEQNMKRLLKIFEERLTD